MITLLNAYINRHGERQISLQGLQSEVNSSELFHLDDSFKKNLLYK